MDWNPLLNKVIRNRNAMAVEDPLVDILAEICKELVRHQDYLESLHAKLQALQEEPLVLRDGATPQSENSYVPIRGPAERRSVSYTEIVAAQMENLPDAPGWLRQAIMDFSKSMPPLTGISLVLPTPTSLTLKLTWPSHSESGVTKDGRHGDVVPNSLEDPTIAPVRPSTRDEG